MHCPIYFNVKIFLWKTYLEVNINSKVHIFYETFTLLLSYVVPVKSKVKISQNFVAFSEYMDFTKEVNLHTSVISQGFFFNSENISWNGKKYDY